MTHGIDANTTPCAINSYASCSTRGFSTNRQSTNVYRRDDDRTSRFQIATKEVSNVPWTYRTPVIGEEGILGGSFRKT